MGSSASKAARKYPEAVGKAVEAGMKRSTVPPAGVTNVTRLAEAHKSEAIERDAVDPHFLANLNKLGPVRVDHHMQTIRPEAKSARQRQLAESETLQLSPGTRNRLYGSSISELLDKHKSVKTYDELVKLAEEFKIDVDKLRGLVRFVNSPSVDKASIRSAPGSKQGEDLWVANAVWVEAKY